MIKYIPGLSLLMAVMFACNPASIDAPEGLWLITKVTIGEEEMTPIARWTELHSDGSFTGGNGWLQNMDGSWSYDEQSRELQTMNDTGFDDPFGPFTVSISSDSTMTWTRLEEGMETVVHYQRIQHKPKSPADLLTGIWDVESATFNGEDVTERWDPEGNRYMFLRWDQLFTDHSAEGTANGIWRVNAHRPVLDVLYYGGNRPLDYWNINFENVDRMTLEREGLVVSYSRLKSLPDN